MRARNVILALVISAFSALADQSLDDALNRPTDSGASSDSGAGRDSGTSRESGAGRSPASSGSDSDAEPSLDLGSLESLSPADKKQMMDLLKKAKSRSKETQEALKLLQKGG